MHGAALNRFSHLVPKMLKRKQSNTKGTCGLKFFTPAELETAQCYEIKCKSVASTCRKKDKRTHRDYEQETACQSKQEKQSEDRLPGADSPQGAAFVYSVE